MPEVKPVEDGVVEATLPHLPEIVADMVRVQWLTDARPGRRRPRDCYAPASYRHAITRAFAALNAERLREDPAAVKIGNGSSNQLRHTAATEIRRQFGLESAQVVLGHASADVTRVHAERNRKLTEEVIKQIG